MYKIRYMKLLIRVKSHKRTKIDYFTRKYNIYQNIKIFVYMGKDISIDLYY